MWYVAVFGMKCNNYIEKWLVILKVAPANADGNALTARSSGTLIYRFTIKISKGWRAFLIRDPRMK